MKRPRGRVECGRVYEDVTACGVSSRIVTSCCVRCSRTLSGIDHRELWETDIVADAETDTSEIYSWTCQKRRSMVTCWSADRCRTC